MQKAVERAWQESALNTRGDIIRWWEARRYTFNAFVLVVAVASWLLLMTAGSAAVETGEDFVEPLVMFSACGIYIALLNVCYTLGWVVDTVLYNGRPRVRLHKSGLILAMILTALPGVWAVVAWLITLSTERKLG
jgi:hypothetical protein